MLYVIGADGNRITASPGATGRCPQCESPMQPKCGQIVIHHWAHHARDDCDPWSEPESQWHLGWKRRLAQAGAHVEVTRKSGELWHRADAAAGDWTLELQHSTLSIVDAWQRERFYGPRLAWLWDMTDPDRWERVHFGRVGFWWKHGAQMQAKLGRPVWWHTPTDDVIRVRLGTVENDDGGSRVLGKVLRCLSASEFADRFGVLNRGAAVESE